MPRMDKAHAKVRAANVQDHPLLAEILADAFQDDPLAIWLCEDPVERFRNNRGFFTQLLGKAGERAAIDMGECGDGVAIWQSVGRAVDLKAPPGARPETGDVFERLSHAAPSPPYWYLAFIGARSKGEGIGQALLRHRLARLSGKVALWTANEKNLNFYNRFGFEVTTRIDGDGIKAGWLTR